MAIEDVGTIRRTVFVNTFTDGTLGPDVELLGPVADGGHIVWNSTPGCWGPMITPAIRGGHEVTRPVAVAGAEVGDAIAIRIRDINEVTSIGKGEEGSKIAVYQNTDRTRLTIRTKSPVHEVSITDISGKVVQHEVVETQQETHEIDTARLGSGVYMVYISTPERIYSSKIMR